MRLTTIQAGLIYEVSGQDLLNIISEAVRQTVNELATMPTPSSNMWAGKHKLNTYEAAEFLGIRPQTLSIWKRKYKIKYEKSRPCYFEVEELRRVERERSVRPW